jgi:hypothetical protein
MKLTKRMGWAVLAIGLGAACSPTPTETLEARRTTARVAAATPKARIPSRLRRPLYDLLHAAAGGEVGAAFGIASALDAMASVSVGQHPGLRVGALVGLPRVGRSDADPRRADCFPAGQQRWCWSGSADPESGPVLLKNPNHHPWSAARRRDGT